MDNDLYSDARQSLATLINQSGIVVRHRGNIKASICFVQKESLEAASRFVGQQKCGCEITPMADESAVNSRPCYEMVIPASLLRNLDLDPACFVRGEYPPMLARAAAIQFICRKSEPQQNHARPKIQQPPNTGERVYNQNPSGGRRSKKGLVYVRPLAIDNDTQLMAAINAHGYLVNTRAGQAHLWMDGWEAATGIWEYLCRHDNRIAAVPRKDAGNGPLAEIMFTGEHAGMGGIRIRPSGIEFLKTNGLRESRIYPGICERTDELRTIARDFFRSKGVRGLCHSGGKATHYDQLADRGRA